MVFGTKFGLFFFCKNLFDEVMDDLPVSFFDFVEFYAGVMVDEAFAVGAGFIYYPDNCAFADDKAAFKLYLQSD